MFQAIFDYPDYRLKFSIKSTRRGCIRYKQCVTHCQMVVPRRHLYNFGPAQSVMLPEVVNCGQVSIIARRSHLKKSKIKRVLAYLRWQTSFTPLTPKSPIPQRYSGDYSKETGWHLLPAFGCAPYKWRLFGRRHTYCDVTTITQTRHLRFRRRQISRWRRRWSKINGVIGFFLLLFFPPRS